MQLLLHVTVVFTWKKRTVWKGYHHLSIMTMIIILLLLLLWFIITKGTPFSSNYTRNLVVRLYTVHL
jgi:hypothetical protein